MDSEFYREQALRARNLAEKADQFTRKRLLALAERYDAKAGGPSRASRIIERAVTLPCDTASPRGLSGRGMKKPKDVKAKMRRPKWSARIAGTGYPPVQTVAPGRRIYPGPCKRCGGKGRLTKPS
jgi:hypothetical protein